MSSFNDCPVKNDTFSLLQYSERKICFTGYGMMIRILIIDDEKNMRQMLMSLLKRHDFEVHACADGASAIEFFLQSPVDVVLCDLQMPGLDGIAVLKRLQEIDSGHTLIMMSAYATVETAVKAMKLGAYNFITKPFTAEEVIRTIEKATEVSQLRKENRQLRDKVEQLQEGRGRFGNIVGESVALMQLIEQAKKVAVYDTSVLVTGDSGTGKELIAQGLHSWGARSEGPFVAVNCGSIPSELLESEFFGHQKGAFTGADRQREGIFVAASGGTVFLDEIGELALDLQVKLLRVLQEKEVRPVGSAVSFPIDVRIVAATAKDLNRAVQDGEFRQDLLYRLNVIELPLPPLRKRREDIPLLVQYFIKRFNERFQRKDEPITGVEREALDLLLRYHWPGNIRELENAVEHAFVYCTGQQLKQADFPQHLRQPTRVHKERSSSFAEVYSLKTGKRLLERKLIKKAMDVTQGNKTRAAELLEISYPSLLQKIKELENQREI